MTDQIQLDFQCPRCRLAGLTPEFDRDAALSLARGAVHLPCPKCGEALRILDSPSGVKHQLWALANAGFLRAAAEELEGVLKEELTTGEDDA